MRQIWGGIRAGGASLGVTVVLVSAVGVASASEAPAELWTRCAVGGGAGQCNLPQGVATDPANGHVYVGDQINRRVEELNAWGGFVKVFGWKVNKTKVDEGASEDEQNLCPVDPEDVCQAGSFALGVSAGAGRFSFPTGVAVDSAGDVFVVDQGNFRVEKFDPEGHFELMIGKGVDQGPNHPGDICTAAYVTGGDACGAGEEGTAPGQFGAWAATGSYIALDTAGTVPDTSDDTLYIGDAGRIQHCNVDGEGCAALADPGGLLSGKGVSGLAVVPSGSGATDAGDLFVARDGMPAILSLDAGSGAKRCEAEVGRPEALASDSAGNVYAVDGHNQAELARPMKVREFGPGCVEDKGFAFFTKDLERSTGLATGEACFGKGEFGLYISNSYAFESFIRAYGPPPSNPECPPPPAAPSITAEYAISIGGSEATLGAQINPHFWSGSIGETNYQLQYGPAACVEAEGWGAVCVRSQPSPKTKLLSGVVNEPVATAGIFIAGLAPQTRYVYRFLAEGSGASGELISGPERHFATYPAPGSPGSGCVNEALRTGASAALPDCRAYEMVSPSEKEGGDIAVRGPTAMDQAAIGGGKVTYSSYRAFGGAKAAPYSSQYIASRGAGGWASEAISPEQRGELFNLEPSIVSSPFEVFSAELGEAWLQTASEPVLAPGGVAEFNNLYRRENGSGRYEACTTGAPEHLAPSEYDPEVEGTASDGSGTAVFAALDRLAGVEKASLAPSKRQLYLCQEGAMTLVSVSPDGAASGEWNVVGTANQFTIRGRTTQATAVSSNASRIYWTATPGESGSGTLFVRANPTAPESHRTHGAASGTGDLIGPAKGTGNPSSGNPIVTKVQVSSGGFAVHQEISDSGGKIPAGTKIVAIEAEPLSKKEEEEEAKPKLKLTLDKATTGGKPGDELTGHASEVVSGLTTSSGEFAAGQEIAGEGISTGSSVLSASPGSLTLSTKATKTEAAAQLAATSPCTEAQSKACTIAVTTTGSLFGGSDAHFWAATADGNEALFSDGGTLYRFALGEAEEGKAPTSLAGGFIGILGQSEDLSRVYLLSEEEVGGEGEAGKPNLYLYEAGGGGSLTFLATLSARDAYQASGEGNYSPANPRPLLHTSRVNPSGSTLAFMSNSGPLAEEVAGYDNTDRSSPAPCGQAGGICDAEIYRYDASGGKLACVSCNPGGARPRGREIGGSGPGELTAPALLPTWETSLYARRPLSDTGNRLFFESYEPLVLSDTNGAADVYEWEAPGTGGCSLESGRYVQSAEGCLYLISSGKDPSDSEFIDATPDGSEAFFTTAQSLIEEDPGSTDLYDARIDGGFPPPPPPPAGCEGQACQAPAPAPQAKTPASAGFRGPGNLREKNPRRRCPKGRRAVRRHGKTRCAPRRHKRHARHKHRHRRRAHARRGAGR